MWGASEASGYNCHEGCQECESELKVSSQELASWGQESLRCEYKNRKAVVFYSKAYDFNVERVWGQRPEGGISVNLYQEKENKERGAATEAGELGQEQKLNISTSQGGSGMGRARTTFLVTGKVVHNFGRILVEWWKVRVLSPFFLALFIRYSMRFRPLYPLISTICELF